MRACERLLKYVSVNTASSLSSDSAPSTECQFRLAKQLADEMRELGMQGVEVDGFCYVYGHLNATEGLENAKRLGFIAHLDTAPDFSGENVNPKVIENYDGGEVALGESGKILSPLMFPHLRRLSGRTLIVTDGTTLLGADDKAGIAEILTLVEELHKKNLPHGKISVCFTPDEEIGSGAEYLDIEKLGADAAYTVDGGEENEIAFENFNACEAEIEFTGVNIHPGDAKDTMVNAALCAVEYNAMLPVWETPRHTEGYEGFFHLTDISGTVDKAFSRYIVRDHDAAKYEMRKETMRRIEKLLNEKYGTGKIRLTLREQYLNMAQKIGPEHGYIIDKAVRAIREAGLEPKTKPIRGGTDGAQLSWRGLPCPNLGTGGCAFHGPYEHITAESMDKCVEILHGIVGLFAE
ncbi:MAG: peptidase T [Clostridia bacterium]|nr:peptidase T [Clostridia bacterium]